MVKYETIESIAQWIIEHEATASAAAKAQQEWNVRTESALTEHQNQLRAMDNTISKQVTKLEVISSNIARSEQKIDESLRRQNADEKRNKQIQTTDELLKDHLSRSAGARQSVVDMNTVLIAIVGLATIVGVILQFVLG